MAFESHLIYGSIVNFNAPHSHGNFFLFLCLSAISMIVACVSFPFGWNSDEFRKICGPEANRFDVGLCGIRWAYALAIIGEFYNARHAVAAT